MSVKIRNTITQAIAVLIEPSFAQQPGPGAQTGPGGPRGPGAKAGAGAGVNPGGGAGAADNANRSPAGPHVARARQLINQDQDFDGAMKELDRQIARAVTLLPT